MMFSDNHPAHTSFIHQDFKLIAKRIDLKYIYTQCSSEDHVKSNESICCIPFPLYSLRTRIQWQAEKRGILINYKNPAFSKSIQNFVNDFQPDIIHCQFAYEGIKLWDNLEKRNQYKWLISFRGYDASHKLRNTAYRRKLNAILSNKNVFGYAVCSFLRDQLSVFGIDVSRVSVLYTGVDTDFFIPSSTVVKKQDIQFVQVGAFNEKKGHQYTIQAFKILMDRYPDRNLSLVFIGQGKYQHTCVELTRELGIESKVKFMGRQDRNVIRSVLSESEVFVHHSITSGIGDTEGIPNAICEAMAMELPIVSTFHAGIPELVTEETTLELTMEKDVDGTANAMAKLMEVGRVPTNRQRIIDSFSIDAHIKKLKSIYTEAVGDY